MTPEEILSIDLQECGSGISSHARVIEQWLEMDGKGLSNPEIMEAMSIAFGMSFEADEALNRVHERLFGTIIHE